MFDIPDMQDRNMSQMLTSTTGAREHFRQLEAQELERILGGSEEYKLLQKVESKLPDGKTLVEYLGLGSMGVFRQKFPGEGEFNYHNRLRSKLQRGTRNDANRELLIRMEHGMETLGRPSCPPLVCETSRQFEELRQNPTLSSRAQRIMGRTNFKGRKYLRHSRVDDAFYHKPRAARLYDLVLSILHISMLRKNYEQAYKAFSVLVRRKRFDIRLLSGIAIELISWKSSQAPRFITWFSASFQWTSLLEGIITSGFVNDPSVLRTRTALALAIFSTRTHQGTDAAFDRLDAQINDSPYHSHPLNWAIHGALAMELGNWYVAAKSFGEVARLGGHVPDYYTKILNSKGIKKELVPSVDPLSVTYGDGDGDFNGELCHMAGPDVVVGSSEEMGIQDLLVTSLEIEGQMDDQEQEQEQDHEHELDTDEDMPEVAGTPETASELDESDAAEDIENEPRQESSSDSEENDEDETDHGSESEHHGSSEEDPGASHHFLTTSIPVSMPTSPPAGQLEHPSSPPAAQPSLFTERASSEPPDGSRRALTRELRQPLGLQPPARFVQARGMTISELVAPMVRAKRTHSDPTRDDLRRDWLAGFNQLSSEGE